MNPIILALDCDSIEEARSLVKATETHIGFYKVGMELYAAGGPTLVRELLGEGHRVFLDLKFHDIGETVKRAVAQVSRLGVTFLTVHAEPQVMRAAVEGRAGSALKVLGVTVLTSIDESDLPAMGYRCTLAELFDLRMRNALDAGVDGLVCSPLEVAKVRAAAGSSKILVTPGVRSAGTAKGDQKRVATPAEAIAAGADYVVVGRQVTRAADRAAETLRILEEIDKKIR